MIRVLERIQWIVEIEEAERTLEPPPTELATVKEIQDAYANGAKPVRAMLESMKEEVLDEPWSISYTGRPLVSTTRGHALISFGLRPLVSVLTELSVLFRALGQEVDHPTPEWPFGDEPEAAIVPEFPAEEIAPPDAATSEADTAGEATPEVGEEQGAESADASESDVEPAAADHADSPGDESSAPEGYRPQDRAEAHASRSFDERYRIRQNRARRA